MDNDPGLLFEHPVYRPQASLDDTHSPRRGAQEHRPGLVGHFPCRGLDSEPVSTGCGESIFDQTPHTRLIGPFAAFSAISVMTHALVAMDEEELRFCAKPGFVITLSARLRGGSSTCPHMSGNVQLYRLCSHGMDDTTVVVPRSVYERPGLHTARLMLHSTPYGRPLNASGQRTKEQLEEGRQGVTDRSLLAYSFNDLRYSLQKQITIQYA
ncbi:hypothetical protein EDB83DRAFT_2317301 [Lactarius deliciosus]|nr:hypothetical protein EDB83DRAFT_2317301 [Lactarius deliciosus]